MNHLRYLSYVLRHKWFVLVECWRRGLYWRGLVHDLSKFLPSEWFPYVEHFHGRQSGRQRDVTGYYKPTDTGDPAFDRAWFLHQKRNDHHWQWWTQPDDMPLARWTVTEFAIEKGPMLALNGQSLVRLEAVGDDDYIHTAANDVAKLCRDSLNGGKVLVLPMSPRARTEMLCDWIGAGRAQGAPDTRSWWRKNGAKMVLHDETRQWVEDAL